MTDNNILNYTDEFTEDPFVSDEAILDFYARHKDHRITLHVGFEDVDEDTKYTDADERATFSTDPSQVLRNSAYWTVNEAAFAQDEFLNEWGNWLWDCANDDEPLENCPYYRYGDARFEKVDIPVWLQAEDGDRLTLATKCEFMYDEEEDDDE